MKYKATLIQFLLFIFIFWIFWTPGIKVASDFHTAEASSLVDNIYPYTWKDTIASVGLGEYTVTVLWSQPLHSLFGILSLTNISFEIIEKILGFLCLTLVFFSIKRLLTFLGMGFWATTVGVFFYLTNTFFILLFDGGQLPLALGYGVLPLTILFFLKRSIWFSFWLLILSFLDLRLIYIVGIVLFINIFYLILFFRQDVNFKKIIYLLLFTMITLVGVHAYWILPSLLSKSPQLPVTYERASQVDFLSFSTLLHSMLLQQPHWYTNSFGKISQPSAWFILIPLLGLVFPLLKRKDKSIFFWMIIVFVGIFLSKGSQEPLSFIYPFLFTHIPGFFLFRDPVKFYFLSSLAYTILISAAIQNLMSLKVGNHYLSKVIKLLPMIVIIYFIWLIRPVYMGQMTGLLSFPIYQKEYLQLENVLRQDKNPSLIFWIPTKSPLGFSNSLYPSVDGSRLGQKRPFIVGSKGTYETLNFLREASYMGEIFDVAGIGYIAYPPLDPRRDDMHPDNILYYYTFSDQLSKLPWLEKKNSSLPLYKTKSHQDRFFVTANTWWIVGSDNIYTESTKSAELKLSKNALIFAEEYPGLGEKIDQLPQAKIVLNGKTLVDLAATFINNSSILFPARNLEFDPNESGWWKREASDLIKWREFLQTKYGIDNQDFDLGGGWAVAEGKRSLKIDKELSSGDILLARVFESTRGGQLSFRSGEQLIGSINTKFSGNNVRWFEVGEIKRHESIEIQASGDINVVNALAILNKDKWVRFKDKAYKLQEKVFDFSEINIKNSIVPTVTYKRINPTKFVVNVVNLTNPTLLVFSQNYDNLWKLNGKSPLPVYSLLNGFEIDADGEYIVEFEAQKHVQPGLMISGLTTLILALLLIRFNIRF